MADAAAAAAAPVMSPEDIAYAARIVFIEQVYFCSLYAVVVWDWVSSLSKEYRLIWKKNWTPVKAIYILCRYWPIATVPWTLYVYTINHPHDFCVKSYRSVPILMTPNMVLAELVLLIRTYAFLGRKTWLLVTMLVALGGVFTYQIYVPLVRMDLLALGPPGVPTPCFPVAQPGSQHVTGFFIAPLLFDTAVTGLTLYKAVTMRWNLPWSKKRESTSIVNTFINEGIFYFILITIANILNGAFYLQKKQVIQALNIPLSIMLPNILACRLILALRSRGNNTDLHVSSNSRYTGGSSSGRTGASDSHHVTFGGTGAKRIQRSDIDTTVTMSNLGPRDADGDSYKLDDKVRVADEENALGAIPLSDINYGSHGSATPFSDLVDATTDTTTQGRLGDKKRPSTGESRSPIIKVEVESSYV
ncbi:hypothetical protein BKA62DRAFT_638478 [Auriculariales sp. MPI-PUGE-AT-0066]|nr:hypothetical protein BKA62DRAFT_638478 [Auriculariales sp. MPI-PUGE-AT-0066]